MNRVYPEFLDMQLIILHDQILAREAYLRWFGKSTSALQIYVGFKGPLP